MDIVIILIILACSTLTYVRNSVWRDPETLGRDTIRKSPGKGRPYYNLGNYFVAQGRLDDAVREFEAAIRVRPTSREYNNLGLVYESKGMIDSAVEMYHYAISMDASNAEAYNNLGKVELMFHNRIDEAIALFNKAVQLKKDYMDASINLAAAYIRGRQFSNAVPILEAVIAKEPGRLNAHYNLGIAYYCLGRASSAQSERNFLLNNNASLAERLDRFMTNPCTGR
jgi:tetratricopeptide (TPR) repeat protein